MPVTSFSSSTSVGFSFALFLIIDFLESIFDPSKNIMLSSMFLSQVFIQKQPKMGQMKRWW